MTMNGMTRDREAPALAAEVSGVLVKLESARRASRDTASGSG